MIFGKKELLVTLWACHAMRRLCDEPNERLRRRVVRYRFDYTRGLAISQPIRSDYIQFLSRVHLLQLLESLEISRSPGQPLFGSLRHFAQEKRCVTIQIRKRGRSR